jgi:hypothetical protein
MDDLLYSTEYGKHYINKYEDKINRLKLKGKLQLVLTSPPFPLKKRSNMGIMMEMNI